jgi:hypothetical protein
MKKVLLCGLGLVVLPITLLIAVPLFLRAVAFIAVLLFSNCNPSPTLDYSKLDTAFFVGVYQTDYRNEIETITLKENGKYDYAHGKNNDTIIKDAGEWGFNKEQQYFYVNDFPNIRERKVYEEKTEKVFDIMMSIDESSSDLGNLYTIDHEESRYTFVKLDKSKNRKYLKKQS